MSGLASYERAEQLEAYLGDPRDPSTPFSNASMVRLDEAESPPEVACGLLDAWGVPAHYVPAEHGGELRRFEELMSLMRVIARRDLTVVVGHAITFLGALPVWIAGSDAQQGRVAAVVRGGRRIAFALTEKEHGSDVLATETRAVWDGEGYVLTGTKWLINNATRGAALVVFARAEGARDAAQGARGLRGARAFSPFLVEKDRIRGGAVRALPKIRTLGTRGADIAGVEFDQCRLDPDAVLGEPGSGLGTILKTLQVTRTMVTSVSLGAADTALRCVLAFARSRKLYRRNVIDIPHARRELTDAFLDLLICDAVATSAARALHVAPENQGLRSSIVKYIVPVALEEAIGRLGVVLGARHYLREEHWAGIFQKIARDASLISLFDGSTIVNLSALTTQLDPIADAVAAGGVAGEEEGALYALGRDVAGYDFARLRVGGLRACDATLGLAAALQRMERSPGANAARVDAARAIVVELSVFADTWRRLRDEKVPLDSPAFFDLAARFCWLHAGAVCVHLWLHSREALDPFFAEGGWLVACLRRIMRRLRGDPFAPPDEAMTQRLLELDDADRAFAIVPIRLAPRPA